MFLTVLLLVFVIKWWCLRSKLNVLGKKILKKDDKMKEMKDELNSICYSVSHDLRAPLRAINGFSRILLKNYQDILDIEAREHLDIIQTNAKQINDYIEGILVFSRLGHQPIKRSKLEMDIIARNVAHNLQNLISNRKVEINIKSLPAVTADPGMMQYVFGHLLSNAIKFTQPRKNARIEISGYRQGDVQLYSVEDNGVGFDMTYGDKLFRLFGRLHTSQEFEGCGTGLATIKRIICRHGGKIWMESEVDKGTTCYFTVPCHADESEMH